MKIFYQLVLTLFCLLFFSPSSQSADYKLVYFEASDYRDFTLEEMMSLIGLNTWLLPHLKCNGVNELDPFFLPLRRNLLRNSLQIKSSIDDTKITYKKNFFRNRLKNKTYRESDPFTQEVLSALYKLEKTYWGSKILRHLEESYFPLEIVRGVNSFNPRAPGMRFRYGIQMSRAVNLFNLRRMSPGLPFTDIGVGGEIRWNPQLKTSAIEEDGISRPVAKEIALAHELYHAFDSIRGLLDPGVVKGEGYPMDSAAEYRGVYFENLLREEMGLKKRKFYTPPSPDQDISTAPDLLDDSGRPIFISGGCFRGEKSE